MSNTVNNILVILASPIDPNDQRLNQISKYSQSFAQICTNNGINIDFLELYKDQEVSITNYLDTDNSKVLEYQIRINNADLIVIFHPVILDSVPSLLKGFLENVFCKGYAFKIEKQLTTGILNTRTIIFAFDEKSKWSNKVLFGNQLENFWNKSIFDLTGLNGSLNTFYNYRSSTSEDLEKIRVKIENVADNIHSKSKQLDL